MSLILGEVLTRRGEKGPLARPWASPRGRPTPRPKKAPIEDDITKKDKG